MAGSGGPGTAGVSGADGDGEGQIESGPWLAVAEDEEDSDRFWTTGWTAVHRETGERRILQVSRFHFAMTTARFRWLVENGFPRPPGKAPWSSSEIDAAMEDGA